MHDTKEYSHALFEGLAVAGDILGIKYLMNKLKINTTTLYQKEQLLQTAATPEMFMV